MDNTALIPLGFSKEAAFLAALVGRIYDHASQQHAFRSATTARDFLHTFTRTLSLLGTAGLMSCAEPVLLYAPPPEPDLGELVADAIFSTRGAGVRTDMVWIAADSVSWRALERAASERGVRLLPPSTTPLLCPGSTNSAGAPIAGTTGYKVTVESWLSEGKHLRVTAKAACSFVFSGAEPRGFHEGRSWAARKSAGGWRLSRLTDAFIT